MKRANNFKDISNQRFGRLVAKTYFQDVFDKTKSHWICECDCGKITCVISKNLIRGATKSCGCLALELRRLPKGMSGFNRIFKQYQTDAKKRNLIFELNDTEFRKLTSSNCYYCGIGPYKIGKAIARRSANTQHSHYIYNGIDRLDSKIGYIIDNCVPCCKTCNFAKQDMSLDDFKNWITRLIKYNGIKDAKK